MGFEWLRETWLRETLFIGHLLDFSLASEVRRVLSLHFMRLKKHMPRTTWPVSSRAGVKPLRMGDEFEKEPGSERARDSGWRGRRPEGVPAALGGQGGQRWRDESSSAASMLLSVQLREGGTVCVSVWSPRPGPRPLLWVPTGFCPSVLKTDAVPPSPLPAPSTGSAQ